jgi:hypothetical protein
MNKEDLQIGYLVYIRDDLEYGKEYGGQHWLDVKPKGKYVRIENFFENAQLGDITYDYSNRFTTSNSDSMYEQMVEMYSFEMIDFSKPIYDKNDFELNNNGDIKIYDETDNEVNISEKDRQKLNNSLMELINILEDEEE